MDGALLGVVIGGVIGVTGSLAAVVGGHLAAMRQDRRRRVVDASAEFLTAVDRLWSAEQGVRLSVFTLTNLSRRDGGARPEEIQAADQHRVAAMREHTEILWAAHRARDVLSITAPDLDPLAEAVLDSTYMPPGDPYRPTATPEQEADRAETRARFVEAARRAV